MSHQLRSIVLLACFVPWASQIARGSEEIAFTKHTIDLGRSETCAVADIDRDGQLDIVSGEHWYAGPGWQKHTYRELGFFNNYVDAFSDLPLDVNDDGALDIVTATWGERVLAWWENPGHGAGLWRKHVFHEGSPVEFAFLIDLDNDGRPAEVLPQFGGKDGGTAWFGLTGGTLHKHTVHTNTFGHGIGAGDVNRDGRVDIVLPKGWLEAPVEPSVEWTLHSEFDVEQRAGFLHVLDINGDGKNDILTTRAHGYGIIWLEQLGTDGDVRSWKIHTIDDSWSQAHALTIADLNADGRPELITGKRLYAHNGHDPGGRESLGVYWYEQIGSAANPAWIRHIIDYGGRAGGGMQIPVIDIDADGDLDIVVAGKGGLFLFENETKRAQVTQRGR